MTKFMVQWEDHPSHLATRLGALLEHQKLVDVTLMCNTHTLRVHRAVLAAGSPYFEGILMRNLGQHPLIVLKDMQFSVLKSLIEFMYCGETSVTEENLPALLQAAKFFQVRGLSAMTKEALGLPAESGSSVNGAPNPSVSIGTHKAFVRPQKRVNIQSVKPKAALAPGATEGRAVFHTVPKTMAAQAAHETQAANAQLLLSLSEGKPKKAGAAATPPNLLKKAVAGAATPPRNRPLGRGVRAEPPPQPPPLTKPTHSNILGNKKRPRPSKPTPPAAAAASSQESTLYQDPETNIIYQIDQQPAAAAAAAEDNVIYQLPDGTISDQHGNPLLDKDGNTQNILNYQLPEPQAAFDMSDGQFVLGGDSEADMPILLDNGDGNFVTVHEDSLKSMAASGFAEGGVAYTTNDKGEYVVYKGAASDADKPVMSVEEALEEMMAEDKEEEEGVDNGITVEGVSCEDGSEDALLEAGSEFLGEDGFLAESSEPAEPFESAASQDQSYLEADTAYHDAAESLGDAYLESEPSFAEAESLLEGEGVSYEGEAGPAEGGAYEAETENVENGVDTSSSSSLLKNALTGGVSAQTATGLPGPDESQEGAEEAEGGGIPFAVGLLPLQDALQKFQDMPEHTPRKTRSADEPADRSKRKASTGSDGSHESKRILLTEDWKISEDECSAAEANG